MSGHQAVRGRVFVVEDSELLRGVIESCVIEGGKLEIAGQAPSAGEAIRGIRALQPDISVIDLNLAKGTGWDVIDAVRDLPGHILILTNCNDGASRAAAAERGVRYFFDKTTEFDAFLACLDTLPLVSRH